jgi:integrase
MFSGYATHWVADRRLEPRSRVWRLAALMPRRFRALVIFAAFTGLRWGELVALRARY